MKSNNLKKRKQKRIIHNDFVIVTTAIELDDQIINNIKSVFGDSLIYEFRVNKDLIGGIKVQKGSDLFDGTIKTKLNILQDHLLVK